MLCEKLEEKMKSTTVEGTIQKLFEGHTVNYINCINVDYKSTRKEAYLDLQLDVKGCKDVYESFDKYVEVEKLDGENKYRAEGHGLQDADKGVLFMDFPPVLQLQLKRFEYDFQRDTMAGPCVSSTSPHGEAASTCLFLYPAPRMHDDVDANVCTLLEPQLEQRTRERVE